MNRPAILLIAAILAAMSFLASVQAAIQRGVDASAAVRIFAPPVRSTIERAADYSRQIANLGP